MTYTANIPQATDDPSQSQPLILANFGQLNSQYGTNLTTGADGDHVAFTAVSGNGKHQRVTLVDSGSAINAVKQAGLNEIRIYAVTQSGVTMPYYTRDNIAIGTTSWPLSPIKAYASFQAIGNVTGDAVAINSFNVTTIHHEINENFYTVTITQAMRTMSYGILYNASPPGNIPTTGSYSITSTTVFTLPINAGATGLVTFLALET